MRQTGLEVDIVERRAEKGRESAGNFMVRHAIYALVYLAVIV